MSSNPLRFVALLVLSLACSFAAPTKKKISAKPSAQAPKSVSAKRTKSAVIPKPVASKSTKSSRTRARVSPAVARKSSRRAAPPRPVVQSVPTTERYKEIQEALAQRGHYQGEATGSWTPDSVQALKSFQKEQNLQPSGKLDSVSIIALGLGPKRNLAANSNPTSVSTPRPEDDHRSSQGNQRP